MIRIKNSSRKNPPENRYPLATWSDHHEALRIHRPGGKQPRKSADEIKYLRCKFFFNFFITIVLIKISPNSI